MIKYVDTTVFNVDTQTIVNAVNCVGVMGAGIALEFKLRFPKMYDDYVNKCRQREIQIGKPYLYRDYSTPWIMNFPTKHHWKYPSKLIWIEQGLEYFVSNYKQGEVTSIAFPKLGADRGRLDWNDVKALMERYLQTVDIEVHICLNQECEASGIEKIMVDMLSSTCEQSLVSEVRIRRNIARQVVSALPLNHFYKLRETRGIGKQSYEKIFKFFYEKAQSTSAYQSRAHQFTEPKQLKLIE